MPATGNHNWSASARCTQQALSPTKNSTKPKPKPPPALKAAGPWKQAASRTPQPPPPPPPERPGVPEGEGEEPAGARCQPGQDEPPAHPLNDEVVVFPQHILRTPHSTRTPMAPHKPLPRYPVSPSSPAARHEQPRYSSLQRSTPAGFLRGESLPEDVPGPRGEPSRRFGLR